MTYFLNSGRFPLLRVFAVSAVGCLIVWGALQNKSNYVTASSVSEMKEDGPVIKGFRYKTYNDGMLVSQVEADEFRIMPKKFFLFRIRSLNEAVATNAKLSIFIPAESHKTDDPFGSLFKEFTNKNGEAGLVTKMTVKGIDISVYNYGALAQHIKATDADLRNDKGQAIFYNATLETPALKTRINAKKIIWDSQKKMFIVPKKGSGNLSLSSGL